MKRNRAPKSGQILIFFLSLTAIGLLLASAVLSLQANSIRTANRVSRGRDAGYLAEAGLEKGFNKYQSNPSYTGETLALGNGTVVISISAGATSNEKVLSAVATVQNVTRRLRVKLATTPNSVAVAFRYALQAGTGGFSIGNGSQLNGNVYSNGNVTGGPGSSISGDAYAVGSISGVTVGGQKKTGQPAEPLPPFDAAFWKQKAQAGGTVNGPYTPANNSTIGPLYINGDLSFGNSSIVTIKGPVYASGKITFGNSPTVQIDNSIGNEGIMMAADGDITFGNGVTVAKNSFGGYLLVATNSTTATAINISNSSASIQAPLYAPNGTLSIGNGGHAVAFAAKTVTTGNNVVITYDQGLANATYNSGPGGGWILSKGSFQEY